MADKTDIPGTQASTPPHPEQPDLAPMTRRDLLRTTGGLVATVAAIGGLGAQQVEAQHLVCPVIDRLLQNNLAYAGSFPGDLGLPIRPSRRVAVVACMDARLDVEKLLGLRVGAAHIIRNAGGVVTDDVIRSLIISHHLLDTQCWMLIHHTKCGMLAFKDDLLRAGLEGDPGAAGALSGATGRSFVTPGVSSPDPAHFAAFRGGATPLDSSNSTPDTNGFSNFTRLEWDVRRGLSRILNHPWIPGSGADAIHVRGFIYDVDTGLLSEVFLTGAPGEMGPFDAGLPFG